MTKQVTLLDATLRDGGQGLDDLFNNHFSDKYYTEKNKHRIIDLLEQSNVDFIELGAIGPSIEDKSKFAIYQNIEDLSRYMPKDSAQNKKFIGLYIGPDTDIDKIPDWNPSLVKYIRVILRYSELRKSLEYCAALVKKGYMMFVQPMLTMRYSNEDLDLVLGMTNDMGAYACYFVDSYGYMDSKDIERLFAYYDKKLNKDIKIGFHAHNNMNLAFSNVKSFLNVDADRELVIDSCATGMGQGAGNLQTELIIPYLNEHFGKHYNYDAILDVCEILDNEMIPSNLWGYSVARLLPAVYHTAYKYALVMRNKYHLTFKEINHILQDMPDELRNRYTKANIESILGSK